MDRIQILECTLRDGGLGLEDAYKNGISNISFTKKQIIDSINHLTNSNLDIIELGSIEITDDDRTRFGIYQNVEEVSKLIPKNKKSDQLYVALYRGPDTPVENIPEWNPTLVDGLRVIIRYSEMKKSMDFCTALANKGYKVFVQPMLTMRYSNEELNYIIEESNKMGAYACYFVDSYGYMMEDDIKKLYSYYDERLEKNIAIGFHAHNNMNLAFSNAVSCLKMINNRNVIIDSCAIGMGQGAGNLQTEIISNYLIQNYKKIYNYESILNLCEIIDSLQQSNLWGYSVTRLLPALYKTAYKYSIVFRENYKLSYSQINKILYSMPDSLRHRYTPERADELINMIIKNNL